MRSRSPRNEKPLHWVASSRRDLLRFPDKVVDNIGYALSVVQFGGHPPSAKPWKGLGPGVSEIVEDAASGTFRTVYTVRFRRAIYVLHAFQKKTRATPQRELNLAAARFKLLAQRTRR